jgi:hypothetical protein
VQQQQRFAGAGPRDVECRAIGLEMEVLDHWRSLGESEKGPRNIIPRLVWSAILA